jgi:hypothetical protein
MKKVTMETDRLGNKFWRLPNGDLHREDGQQLYILQVPKVGL